MSEPLEHFDLSGKTALVTGGATGLGFHMSRALARAGADVLIVARRTKVLEEAAEELRKDPFIKKVDWYSVDLQDRADVESLAKQVLSTYGGIDILVGNAGTAATQQITELTAEAIDSGMQLNLVSNMQLARAFLPGMKKKKWGRFIFSSSIASALIGPLEGTSTYAASKAALNAFCRQIAADSGHFNITANAMVLGFFMTDILKNGVQYIKENSGEEAAQKFLDDFVSLTALGRIGDPSEIEGLVQLLASNAGSYITGASLAIDGGMGIMMRPLPATIELE